MVFIYIAIGLLVTWTIVTYYVEDKGVLIFDESHDPSNAKHCLLLFDPDPINSYDEEICRLIMKVFSNNNWNVTLASYEGFETSETMNFDFIVFCANAYNLGPDRITKRFIGKSPFLKEVAASAIVLGNFYRDRILKKVENLIEKEGGIVVNSEDLLNVYNLYRKDGEVKLRTYDLLDRWIKGLDIFSNKSKM